MSRASFSYTHGDTGSKPVGGLDFQSNQRPDAQNFDWYWYNVIEAIKGHAAEFTRLDDDNDGQVNSADYADNAGQLEGENAGAFADSGHTHDSRYLNDNAGTVAESNLNFDPAKQSDLHAKYTDSEARTAVNGADINIAGDADTVDGNHAGDFASSGHTHDGRYYTESQADSRFINDGDAVPHPSYASKSDVPTLEKGEIVFVDGDGLYMEDGN